MWVWGGRELNLVQGERGTRYSLYGSVNVDPLYGSVNVAFKSDMSKQFNATESFWYKGVATFFSGGETTNLFLQLSVILQEIVSAC